jgi:hypothetical protein
MLAVDFVPESRRFSRASPRVFTFLVHSTELLHVFGFVRTSALLLVASAIGCGSGDSPVSYCCGYLPGKPLEGGTVTFSTTAESAGLPGH